MSTPSNSNGPVVLLTLLKDQLNYLNGSPKELIDTFELTSQAFVKCGSESQLLDLLTKKPHPRAVFVQDNAVSSPEFSSSTNALIRYANDGGTLVLGWGYANNVLPDQMDILFGMKLGLPWRAGSYFRTTFHRQERGAMDWSIVKPDGLTASFSAKSFSIRQVPPTSALYCPSSTSVIESLVFPEDFFPVDVHETVVAFTRFGKGFFGYTGDVNAETDTTKAHLAMIGLPHDNVPSTHNLPGRFTVNYPADEAGRAAAAAHPFPIASDVVRQHGDGFYQGTKIGGWPPRYGPIEEMEGVMGPPPAWLNPCQACGKASTMRCSRCRNVNYCGAAHQKQDWKHHKRVCQAS
ncbi:hypothetical protein BDZ89DRAFT_1156248 [Hymenopellis radicata]|nr:hypothetical protein BDZ89DRAFT_1156248 [Hymenopellis radicata]